MFYRPDPIRDLDKARIKAIFDLNKMVDSLNITLSEVNQQISALEYRRQSLLAEIADIQRELNKLRGENNGIREKSW